MVAAPRGEPMREDGEALAWQVRHLDLHQPTRAVADWAARLPAAQRQALLLSTSAALAAATDEPPGRQAAPAAPLDLVGRWTSAYRYSSRSRGGDLEGRHEIDLRCDNGHLVGRSAPHESGSVLDLHLAVNGTIAGGTWTERTSPSGHYRAATYHGLLQLVVDPTGRQMTGRWLGVGKRFTVKSGEWVLTWVGLPGRSDHEPVMTATTVEPAATSPSSITVSRPSSILPT